MNWKRRIKRLLGSDLITLVQLDAPCEYLGSSYGGYCVCYSGLGPDSIVYSFGVGEDVSFDLALIERFGMVVHAFDPTPRSIEWARSMTLPDAFKMHSFGLAQDDKIATFHPPRKAANVSHSIVARPRTCGQTIRAEFYRLTTIMEKLHHDRVDVLKMDIEGAEYAVLEDMLDCQIEVSQILVEFHHHLEGIDISQTRRSVELLNRAGYKIFHISFSGYEYSFLKGCLR